MNFEKHLINIRSQMLCVTVKCHPLSPCHHIIPALKFILNGIHLFLIDSSIIYRRLCAVPVDKLKPDLLAE